MTARIAAAWAISGTLAALLLVLLFGVLPAVVVTGLASLVVLLSHDVDHLEDPETITLEELRRRRGHIS